MGRVVMSHRWGRTHTRASSHSTCALARAVLGVLTLSSVACGVDERALSSSSGGQNAAGTNNVGRAGQGETSGGGSHGGTDEQVPIPLCDYSAGTPADCTTLAQNPGFDTDAEGWDPQGGVYGLWRKNDAGNSEASGSIDVLNTLYGDDKGRLGGIAPGAARQCLPATPGKSYDLAGDVFIEEGQGDGDMPGAPYEGAAALGAYFFDNEECDTKNMGTSIGFFNANEVTTSNEWVHVTASGTAPERTRAISIRLNTIKPIREYTFTATFDNVFVRER